jgi:cytosine/adenosine deaminase-related metal-dependent hydrolase
MSPPTIYRASWVCPGDRPPIDNGCVVVHDGRISFVGSFASRPENDSKSQVIDLGEGAIIPGLVNAHTHLEFSDLVQPFGKPGIKFTDWIRLVVNHRRNVRASDVEKKDAIIQGIKESFDAGVWSIGEISTQPILANAYSKFSHQRPVEIALFLEQLGHSPDKFQSLRQELSEHLQSNKLADKRLSFAASPHAPYSVNWQLFDQVVQEASTADAPVAMHIAETTAERQFLDSSTGDFVDLLQDFGVWEQISFSPRRSIKGFLGRLSHAPRSLVIHGNYLTDEELDIIARNKNMSIVYCPRTHHFFGHAPYPLKAMLDRDITVALGTDSRASNPDLDLFEELKLVASRFGWLKWDEVLRLSTKNAADALGVEARLGTLAANKEAAISFVAQPTRSGTKLDDWLFSKESKCRAIV